MIVVEESVNYAVVKFPFSDVKELKDALMLLEDIRAMGLKPLHRLDKNTIYADCFVCEKTNKYKTDN